MVYTGLEAIHLILGCWGLLMGLFFFANPYFSRACDSRRITAELKRNPSSCRLEKAECLEVWLIYEPRTDNEPGGVRWKGIFVARDGVRYVADRKPEHGSGIISSSNQDRMLAVLFSANFRPLSDDRIAESCQTPQGLRAEYASLIPRAGKMVRGARAHDAQYRPASGDFDCLLFLGGTRGPFATHGSRMVTLVGVLGEDRITYFGGYEFVCTSMLLFSLTPIFILAMSIVGYGMSGLRDHDHHDAGTRAFMVAAIIFGILWVPALFSLSLRWRRRSLAKFKQMVGELPSASESSRDMI